MSTTGELLMAMYEAMRARYGHQHWWPSRAGAESPEGKLEICAGAVLTQNTSWRNVERALDNLRRAGLLSVGALHQAPAEALAEVIRPAGYYNVKARRLKNFIARVYETFGEDIAAFLDRPGSTLREELLRIKGIGRETADSMVLYAAGQCTFVVDAYTARILGRHKLIGPEDDYEQIRSLFESQLPERLDLWQDYHAQLVAVGKAYCRPRARCAGCPLEPFDHDPEPAAWG